MKLLTIAHKFFEGWDVSLATNHSILVLIRIQEFVTEFLPMQDMTNCKNFAGQLSW